MATASTDTSDRSGLQAVYWAVGILVGIVIVSAVVMQVSKPLAAPAPAGPSIESLLDRFQDSGLSAGNPRDNSAGCAQLGCERMVTTDAITVLTFETRAKAVGYAAQAPDTYQWGRFVLSYAAARTPADVRPQYETQLRVEVDVENGD